MSAAAARRLRAHRERREVRLPDRSPTARDTRPTRRANQARSIRDGRTVSCRIRVTLPADAWMARLTTSHPRVRVEVLDRLEISPRRVLFDVELPTVEETDWAEELRSLPDVESVELVDADSRSEVYRVLFGGRTFVPLAKRLRVLRRFPFPIQNGVATWLLVGPEARVRGMLDDLRQSRVEFRVDSLRSGLRTGAVALLTVRQQEVLGRAVAEGYFDVPRRVTLTELAARMGIASSTLSVTLAVVERKIVEPMASGRVGPAPLNDDPSGGRAVDARPDRGRTRDRSARQPHD